MVSLRKRLRACLTAALLVAAVPVLGGALVACGGDDDGDGGDSGSAQTTETATTEGNDAVAQAEEAVAQAREPIGALEGPTECAGPLPEGKSITIIPSVQAPLPVRAAEGTKIAVEAAGWTATILDGEGNPQGWANAVNRAVTSGADGIITVAMPTQLIQPQIDEANEAGIPVFGALADVDVRSDPLPPPPPGLVNYATADGFQMGYLLGQWVVQDSPDGAQAMRLNSPEIENLQRYSDGFKAGFESGGSGFEIVDEAQSPLSDLQGSKGPQRIAAMMRKNPDAGYMMTMSETWFPIFQQAQKLVGREDMVGLGADGDFAVPMIKDGAKLVISAPDTLLYGWYAVDGLVRAYNELEQPRYEIDIQLVDSTNAGEIQGDAIAATVDYKAEFMKLWECTP